MEGERAEFVKQQVGFQAGAVSDYSLLLGLAFEFPANWFIETRYVRGLTDNYQDHSGLKTSAVQLSVGYLFHW